MSKENIEIINNLIDLSKIVLPALFTLLAGSFGYRYGLRLMKNQKRLEFIERQLREFYSPMLGCLKRIKAKSELRFEISKASDPAWQKICGEHPKPFLEHKKYFEPFEKQIMYDNKQLREELIPLYDKMLAIFTENYYLAESETKNWYSELTRFVEIWHRWLDESIPAEVIKELEHKEERLTPFYQGLESQIVKLQKELSGK
ncbi:MAG: hypothetical protein HZA11_11780 [Nitrospirae bacterium]|nr:hypothetical protein [Nitrospirota bacterium]